MALAKFAVSFSLAFGFYGKKGRVHDPIRLLTALRLEPANLALCSSEYKLFGDYIPDESLLAEMQCP
ncbi:hypothetical protein AC578_1768 [Pseudocercospora eumusae]|uniref:Uncharacterized protein n=1 Tax=Pseudocercospora eumusae TaxID=321146 RepID=A0A139H7J2_9PEZI|nr:hypothetical protein AC578_1768 [Pseudocercospora eumusae]